jgi:hypothetical protein
MFSQLFVFAWYLLDTVRCRHDNVWRNERSSADVEVVVLSCDLLALEDGAHARPLAELGRRRLGVGLDANTDSVRIATTALGGKRNRLEKS